MIKQILVSSSLIFIVLMLLMYLLQRHLIYIPARQVIKLQDYQANDMQSVLLHTKDGLVLNAWYKPAMKQQATVLYFHGNAGHIGYRMPLIRQFINAGLGILLVEYRGYGGNPGSPTEHGLYEDGRAGAQFLQLQGVPSQRWVLYGESLGTGVATQLASEYSVCAVVLQSPFTSMVALARYHYPWLIVKPWDRFDSLARIKTIHASLLILHGKRDQLVPYQQGVTLFERAREPKNMLSFTQGDHNNLWGYQEFSEEVINFIQTACSQ
jgi:fermentation-respiration switch protein FrsA (DUF1100 family)